MNDIPDKLLPSPTAATIVWCGDTLFAFADDTTALHADVCLPLMHVIATGVHTLLKDAGLSPPLAATWGKEAAAAFSVDYKMLELAQHEYSSFRRQLKMETEEAVSLIAPAMKVRG